MISLLVAMDKNRVIGVNNRLPWHLPADLAYFKQTTMGHSIIMGRKTYEAIGRPLPGRKNIILTRDPDFSADGCLIIHGIGEILELNRRQPDDELFVIGGAELFSQILGDANRLYLTYIDAEFPGDTFFPDIREADWTLVRETKGTRNEKNPYDYYFRVYERV